MSLTCKLNSHRQSMKDEIHSPCQAKGASPTILAEIGMFITEISKQRYFEPQRIEDKAHLLLTSAIGRRDRSRTLR